MKTIIKTNIYLIRSNGNNNSNSKHNNNSTTNNNSNNNEHNDNNLVQSVFKTHVCFCGLDSGNLKFETVRTNRQHI